MNNQMMKMFMFPMLAASMLACGSDAEPETSIVEPTFGSADSLSSVSEKATLAFGESISGVFDEDVAFHGYRFSSLGDGVIDVEITRKGSSSKLDTTLFVFGQKSFQNWERIAFDKDAGWGKLSRLRGVEMIDDYKQYMVVVGTAQGTGRGKYNLELVCANEQCINDTPVVFDDCDDSVYEAYETCVENELDNADWGFGDPAEEWSIEYCIDDGVLEHRAWECDGVSAFAPDYCRATDAAIMNVSSACEERLKEDYNVFDTLRITRMNMTQPLEEFAEELFDSNDFVWFDLSGYRVPTSATSKQIGHSLRAEHPFSSEMSVFNAVSRHNYEASHDELERLKTLLEAEYGSSYYEVIEVSGSYAPAAGAEEWTTMTVFHFTRKNIAFVLTEVSGD